jgi:hypothetical protein
MSVIRARGLGRSDVYTPCSFLVANEAQFSFCSREDVVTYVSD